MPTLEYTLDYNEDLVGFVVTEKATGKTLNLQWECLQGPRPVLTFGASGDDTHRDFSPDACAAMLEWANSQASVQALTEAVVTVWGLNGPHWFSSPCDAAAITTECDRLNCQG